MTVRSLRFSQCQERSKETDSHAELSRRELGLDRCSCLHATCTADASIVRQLHCALSFISAQVAVEWGRKEFERRTLHENVNTVEYAIQQGNR